MSFFKRAQRLLGIGNLFENSSSQSNLTGNSGWDSLQTVDGLLVEEFHYLLQFVSEGRFYSFDDVDALKAHKIELFKTIEKELAKEVMAEETRGVSRATAEQNQHNLRRIIVGLTGD